MASQSSENQISLFSGPTGWHFLRFRQENIITTLTTPSKIYLSSLLTQLVAVVIECNHVKHTREEISEINILANFYLCGGRHTS